MGSTRAGAEPEKMHRIAPQVWAGRRETYRDLYRAAIPVKRRPELDRWRRGELDPLLT
jgi:hypothetical protein